MSFNGPYSSEPNEWPTQDISSQANRPYDMSENSLPQNTILRPVFPLEGDRCGCFGIAYTENERLFIDESPNTMINCNCGYYEYIDPNDVPHPSQVPMDLANTAAIHEDSRIAKEDPKYTPDIYGSKPISSTGYARISPMRFSIIVIHVNYVPSIAIAYTPFMSSAGTHSPQIPSTAVPNPRPVTKRSPTTIARPLGIIPKNQLLEIDLTVRIVIVCVLERMGLHEKII